MFTCISRLGTNKLNTREWRGEAEATASLAAVGVRLHVAVEVTRLRKPKVAHLAAVRLLAAVDPLVLGER